MKTNLIDIFLVISMLLGVIIILSAIYKVIFKNQNIDKPAITWLIAGVILVIIPVAGNISIQYGDLKVLINNTNEQIKQQESNLSALKTANDRLLTKSNELKNQLSQYRTIMSNPHATNIQRENAFNLVNNNVSDLKESTSALNSSMDKAIARNDSVKNNLRKFDNKKWFRK